MVRRSGHLVQAGPAGRPLPRLRPSSRRLIGPHVSMPDRCADYGSCGRPRSPSASDPPSRTRALDQDPRRPQRLRHATGACSVGSPHRGGVRAGRTDRAQALPDRHRGAVQDRCARRRPQAQRMSLVGSRVSVVAVARPSMWLCFARLRRVLSFCNASDELDLGDSLSRRRLAEGVAALLFCCSRALDAESATTAISTRRMRMLVQSCERISCESLSAPRL